MIELYAETVVKRRENIQSIGMRVGLIVLVILSFMISGISPLLTILPAVAIVAAFYLFPRLSVEYEYVFCDGQIDFDKIMGKAKRKNMLKMDFEQVELVAPTNSHALDSYKSKNYTTKNYSSLTPDAKTYTIIGKSMKNAEGQNIRVIFEPTEKMIESMRLKSPKKVITD